MDGYIDVGALPNVRRECDHRSEILIATKGSIINDIMCIDAAILACSRSGQQEFSGASRLLARPQHNPLDLPPARDVDDRDLAAAIFLQMQDKPAAVGLNAPQLRAWFDGELRRPALRGLHGSSRKRRVHGGLGQFAGLQVNADEKKAEADDEQHAHDDNRDLQHPQLPRREGVAGLCFSFVQHRVSMIREMSAMPTRSLTAEISDQGVRLDRFIAAALPDLSRSRVRDLIKNGQVSGLGGTIVEPDYRVKPAEMFDVAVPEPEDAGPQPEAIALNVLYEDAALIVIDKPAGLVVHPAAGHWTGTLVNALIAHCGDSLSGIGGVRRPGIVHRLDKDTSGIMVAAKTDAAHRGLAAQFADHGRSGGLDRRYKALVWGAPRPAEGMIEGNIGRHPASRLKMAVLAFAGKPAMTAYVTEEKFATGANAPVASLLECRLMTGRTHQIRVHLAHKGHPVIGDDVYGGGFRSKTRALPEAAQSAILRMHRQALHAAVLGFYHPITSQPLRFHSELPDDMREVIKALAKMRNASGPRFA